MSFNVNEDYDFDSFYKQMEKDRQILLDKKRKFAEQEKETIKQAKEVGKIQVIWTLTKGTNVNYKHLFVDTVPSSRKKQFGGDNTGIMQAKIVSFNSLKKWLDENHYERYHASLCAAFGLDMDCYSLSKS
eukprot:Awhi_evm1s9852